MGIDDNLEIIYLKCPHCGEVAKTGQWITIALSTTPCSASFSFMGNPKKSNSLMCPKCKTDCRYLDIVKAMKQEQ